MARVGNAPGEDDYFLASEVIGAPPEPSGGFRDGEGRLKRQGVRFRIFARLATGECREVTLDLAERIEWRVHVANLKAGWYQFGQAMDLPDGLSKPARRRNGEVRNRSKLEIRPAAVTVSGRNVSGPEGRFDSGQFYERFVELGEARTDASGRLVVLGGRGKSAPFKPGMRPVTFANNEGWHDDTADGPVRATVVIGGRSFEAEPGYVVVTPPNYAPGLFGVVTMDDTIRETFIEAGWVERPTTTRFTDDVWRLFDRLTGLQWVNHGLFVAHGIGSPLDARDDAVIRRLRDGSAEGRAWRERVFGLFRDPRGTEGRLDRLRLPYIYGDAFGEEDDHPRGLLALAPTQYDHLARWARGEFEDDWRGLPASPAFDDLPPAEQVAHLERAPLHECLGGPFHPGIELTWVMRRASLWRAPYRLNLLPEGEATRQGFGEELTPAVCLGEGGPLTAAGPGALTRWLGVPWQTDEASCNSDADYRPSLYLSMPSYWGARVPDQVLSAAAWERASDPDSGLFQRLKHFSYREDWLRDVRSGDYYGRIANMVEHWWTLGVVRGETVAQEGRDAGSPDRVHVETGRAVENAGTDVKRRLVAAIERLNAPPGDAAESAGAVPGGEPPYQPPRRTFHQGEV